MYTNTTAVAGLVPPVGEKFATRDMQDARSRPARHGPACAAVQKSATMAAMRDGDVLWEGCCRGWSYGFTRRRVNPNARQGLRPQLVSLPRTRGGHSDPRP